MSKLAPILIVALFFVVLAVADTKTTTTDVKAVDKDMSFESSDSSASSSNKGPATPSPDITEDNNRYNHKFAPYMGFMIAVLCLILVVAGFIFYSKKQSEGEYNPMA